MATIDRNRRDRRWYRPQAIAGSLAIRPRLLIAAASVVLAAVCLPGTWPGTVRTAIAGDVGALVYLALSLRIMLASHSEVIRKRAAQQDDGASVILIVVLMAIGFSFWTVIGVLSEAKSAAGAVKLCYAGLAAATIILSWFMTQVVFTFHYAHEYYRPDDNSERMAGGLDFRNDSKPDYWDFFYFATSFGAASQTSDVTIRTKALRKFATLHAVISFFFNTAVLALAINLGASLM